MVALTFWCAPAFDRGFEGFTVLYERALRLCLRRRWVVLGLLVLSTIFAWIVGNTLGALAGYFRDSRLLKVIGVGVMALQPIPTYIIGLTLVICLGYLWPVLPISGGAQGLRIVRTRASSNHWSGVVPVCSLKRRLNVRGLVDALEASPSKVSGRLAFFAIHSSSGDRLDRVAGGAW